MSSLPRLTAFFQRKLLFTGAVFALLFAGAVCTIAGTLAGLISFRDVGFPDSAMLVRVGEFLSSGHLYFDNDRPPYYLTIYGPFSYILLSVPYRLAQAAGITPQILVRFGIVAAFCLCVLLVFLISRRLYDSHAGAWICALFALSTLPFAFWTTQIRGDFLALALSLLSLYLVLRSNRRSQLIGAAICAGAAMLTKQTYIAAPVAVACWLVYRRRYKDAALWTFGVIVTVASVYAVLGSREPWMMKNISALRHPVFEYRQAFMIFGKAAVQPVAAFAALGGYFALRSRIPERLLFLVYCVVAWLAAIFTIPQVGETLTIFGNH